MSDSMLIPGAEPYLLPGNRTGVILIHGFTGAPFEMRELGEHLNQQGYTVLGVRLAAHGTKVEDMNRAHWQDWLASVEDAWHLLQNITDRIYVGGLSMGGVLSLLFSAHFPAAGTMALAAPYAMPKGPKTKFIKPISWIIHIAPKGEESDWFDKESEAIHICYDTDPVKGALQLQEMLEVMRNELPNLASPLLLIYSKDDQTVKFEEGHIDMVYQAAGSAIKEKMLLEGSGHVLTRDAKRQEVFAACSDFLKRMEKEYTA